MRYLKQCHCKIESKDIEKNKNPDPNIYASNNITELYRWQKIYVLQLPHLQGPDNL